MESGITKATAIQTLCSMWGIDIKNAIAFGDNYNDVEMLEAVGHGYLMGNAPDELKERIKKHTRDNNNDGIYYALLEMNLINHTIRHSESVQSTLFIKKGQPIAFKDFNSLKQ